MVSTSETKSNANTREKLGSLLDIFSVSNLCKALLISGLLVYLVFILNPNCPAIGLSRIGGLKARLIQSNSKSPPTKLSHLVFGLLGSEKAWHQRKSYIESWWRPNVTRGHIYLDKPPTGELLPWSSATPPYRISDDLTDLVAETKAVAPIMIRMVHGIMEAFRDGDGDGDGELRWLVMGDDDTIFLVDNLVDVLSEYDHTNYYYFGGQSEFIMSNYWYSFNQGFGGGGFILSYPLAKALARDMESCLRRYAQLKSADLITMSCIADVGANLSPLKGIHQVDLRGDISGFLSSHPQAPLISLHHFDAVDPIFPSKDRYESAHHLMRAAGFDQSRMLQQTICHQRQSRWSLSIAWGYSVHLYEKIMPRSWLQLPVETFETWIHHPHPPHYMFNTRRASNRPCEAPHVFFLESVEMKKTSSGSSNEIKTVYSRASARGVPPCMRTSKGGNNSADDVSRIEIVSAAAKRVDRGRCECCEMDEATGSSSAVIKVRIRECKVDEIIA